jgi:hypothetical protein
MPGYDQQLQHVPQQRISWGAEQEMVQQSSHGGGHPDPYQQQAPTYGQGAQQGGHADPYWQQGQGGW